MATGPNAGLYQNAQSASYLPPTLVCIQKKKEEKKTNEKCTLVNNSGLNIPCIVFVAHKFETRIALVWLSAEKNLYMVCHSNCLVFKCV